MGEFGQQLLETGHLVHLGNAVLVGAGAGVDPEVQRLKKGEGPVKIQVAEISAMDVIQQVAQQLAPFVTAIPQVKAGLQREQAGPAGDEVVGVMVDPGFPPLKLPVGNKQPFLTQMEDATTGIVRHSPQFPRSDEAAPAQANQGTATLVHLIQKGQDMQLALHWQEVERKEVIYCFPATVDRN